MHRWHFQRLLRWLIPVLIALILLSSMVARQKARGVGLSFASDEAYIHAAVAENFLSNVSYGVSEDGRMLAVQDVLWQLLLTVVGGVLSDPLSAACLIGAVCSIITLLLSLRMTRLLFPFPPFILYTAVLLVVTPGYLAGAFTGTPVALAATLVTAACLFHTEGLAGRRNPLPMASAFLLGLAAMLRVEFFLVWLVFFLHALLINLFPKKERISWFYLLLRGVNGLLMIVLCLTPLFAWNYAVIHIPWPQTPGAPLTMDLFAMVSPGAAFSRVSGVALAAIPAAFGQLFHSPLLESAAIRLLVLGGALLIAVLAFSHEEEKSYSLIPCLILLLPVLYAMVYPFTGWSSAPMVFSSLAPVLVMAATFFFFRLPFIIEAVYLKWKEGIPEANYFKFAWVVVGSLLLLICLWKTETGIRRNLDRLTATKMSRECVTDYIRSDRLIEALIATDQPGWLAFECHVRPLDITGRAQPEALACLDENGRMNPGKLAEWVKGKKPKALMLWDPRISVFSSLLPSEVVRLSACSPKAAALPGVWRITAFAAP
ncbi:MAG: hypothetical protein V2A34_02910 [Lentisphaerota bacterium]